MLLFIASISPGGKKDFRKEGFKEADELQCDYEFFPFNGEKRETPDLHFCLLPLRGKVTLLSAANCI